MKEITLKKREVKKCKLPNYHIEVLTNSKRIKEEMKDSQ